MWPTGSRAGDVIAVDGRRCAARATGARARERGSCGSWCRPSASGLALTLASVPADIRPGCGAELNAALDVLGLVALKGKVVTADALHSNGRTVAAIRSKGATGAWC